MLSQVVITDMIGHDAVLVIANWKKKETSRATVSQVLLPVALALYQHEHTAIHVYTVISITGRTGGTDRCYRPKETGLGKSEVLCCR